MAIVHESFATNVQASASTITITKPTSTATGDVLVATIRSAGTPTITAPAGWVKVGELLVSNRTMASFYLVAGASEPADYTFSLGESTSNSGGGINRYSGVDNAFPVASNFTTNSGTGTSATWSTVTTTVADAMLIAGFASNTQTVLQTAPPTGFTERWASSRGGYNDGPQVTAGASGDKTNTFDASYNWATTFWAIAPESVSGIEGALTATLANVTSDATGTLAISGATSSTLATIGISASGSLQINAELSTTLGALGLDASGSLAEVRTGELAVELGGMTLGAASTLEINGEASIALGSLIVEATGELSINGQAIISLGTMTLTGAGIGVVIAQVMTQGIVSGAGSIGSIQGVGSNGIIRGPATTGSIGA